MPRNTRLLGVHLTPAARAVLDRRATTDGTTVAHIVRKSLAEWFGDSVFTDLPRVGRPSSEDKTSRSRRR